MIAKTLGAPEVYGKDRIFAYLRLAADSDSDQDAKVAALEKAGQPVVRITVSDIYNLGQEFFRWEIATAVAGSDHRHQRLQSAGRGSQQNRNQKTDNRI